MTPELHHPGPIERGSRTKLPGVATTDHPLKLRSDDLTAPIIGWLTKGHYVPGQVLNQARM